MKEIKSKYDDMLIKGAKLNFQVFPTLELEDKNLKFIHLISSAVLSGSFKNVCFYNASFFSTKFSETSFEGCNLKSTDICSIWANSCKFHDVDFSDATIADSTFINCIFDKAIFESVSLTRCQFINCTFEQFFVDNSTVSLNTFTHCQIKNTDFTDSFYYQIFDDCTFYKANMDILLFGFNFGFSFNTFSQLTKNIDLVAANKDFINKGLYINAAILRINQVQNHFDEAMIACVTAIGKMIQHDILIKADEIEFLKNITSYLWNQKQIAPISILQIWKVLNNYVNSLTNTSANKAIPHINEYANMLYFQFIDFQKELQDRLDAFPQTDNIFDNVELKIVYSEKPTLPLLELLSEFSILASSDCPAPSLIRVENGSFIEFHNIALMVIPYLQTFFALLGVVVPIVIYEKQKKDHKQEEEEKKSKLEITLTTTGANSSPILLPNITTITPTTNTVITDVTKILETQPKINCVGFSGYNAQNVQSITIRFY